MDTLEVTPKNSPCGGRLPDLEVPMINTIVSCLSCEHRKLDERIIQLAYVSSRAAAKPDSKEERTRMTEMWSEIEHDLWPHLQIEDELILSWGQAHHAIGADLIARLSAERKELRELLASLPSVDVEQTTESRQDFARTLVAIVQKLDSHIERYDNEIQPAILRALFSDHPVAAKELKELNP
ncbi:MAG TPA: hemerythrin domain-containing protein [Candidatus Binataceae bacterium]|nr:hemerythrin domain-containing protein [Candidatus Binataceae bacterium]